MGLVMDEVAIPLRVVPHGTADELLAHVTAIETVQAAALDEELVLHALVEDADGLDPYEVLMSLEAVAPQRSA